MKNPNFVLSYRKGNGSPLFLSLSWRDGRADWNLAEGWKSLRCKDLICPCVTVFKPLQFHSCLDENLKSPSASDGKLKQFLALGGGHERVNLVSGNLVSLLWRSFCGIFGSFVMWALAEFYMHFSSPKIAGISFLAEMHKDPITGLDPILQV